MTERFGAQAPKHVAVQNLDGSITDRTILYNIKVANGGRLPPELEKYSKYDTFDAGTYTKLLDTWYDIWKQSMNNVPTTKVPPVNFDAPPPPGWLTK